MDETLKGIIQNNSPFHGKNVVALQLVYCLAYSEAAAFLFENYPSLATYAFWRAINSPPSPLDQLDRVNVIMSVILCLTIAVILFTTTLLLTAWREYLRFKHACKTWQEKLGQGIVMALGTLLLAAIITFLWQIVSLAWKVAILDERVLPSGDLLWGWIALCEDVESMKDRLSFCDERAFLIKTCLAWMLASYFAYFLFLKPAKYEDRTPTATPVATTRAVGKVLPRQLAKPMDDTSASNTGGDWADDDDVEHGKGAQAKARVPAETSSKSTSQPNSPPKARPTSQNGQSGTKQAQPVIRSTASAPKRAEPSNSSTQKKERHSSGADKTEQTPLDRVISDKESSKITRKW